MAWHHISVENLRSELSKYWVSTDPRPCSLRFAWFAQHHRILSRSFFRRSAMSVQPAQNAMESVRRVANVHMHTRTWNAHLHLDETSTAEQPLKVAPLFPLRQRAKRPRPGRSRLPSRPRSVRLKPLLAPAGIWTSFLHRSHGDAHEGEARGKGAPKGM
jgi:hypothetical protein